MPRYYFDVQSGGGERYVDEEGLDLRDLKAAEVEAMQTLVGIANDSTLWAEGPIRRLRFAPPREDYFAFPSSTEMWERGIEAASALCRSLTAVDHL
ncbi:DUF6894 family protein [Bradyrhizobium genosp. L]|uniref:DUF6894 family protein n=1 Tax=Bradyrhizobium genosp. L TaxID=83637 RepID=UPI003D9BB109